MVIFIGSSTLLVLSHGIELARECEPVVTAMRDRKVLINGTDETVLRFLPPLIIGEQHVEEALAALRASLAALH